MQEVYRIIVSPYHYDYWDIFTTDKELFLKVAKYADTDSASKALGDTWEDLVDSYSQPDFPYVILGETNIHQRD